MLLGTVILGKLKNSCFSRLEATSVIRKDELSKCQIFKLSNLTCIKVRFPRWQQFPSELIPAISQKRVPPKKAYKT